MNDRFKFRFWNGRKILYDDLPQLELYNCEDYKWMQCTGLKDKNGKLIYEGDILGGIYENLDIFYCKECMQFELHANGYGCMCCNGDIHWCEVVEDNNKLEVIGNIYENKELLESEG